jgi:hypothetical protein
VRYLLLIYQEPPENDPGPMAVQEINNEYAAYTRWLRESGAMEAGEALQPIQTATTVRVRDGETIATDGPFAETKEHLGGFYLIEASDLDAAIDAAGRLPTAKWGSVEIRPILELPPEYQEAAAARPAAARG